MSTGRYHYSPYRPYQNRSHISSGRYHYSSNRPYPDTTPGNLLLNTVIFIPTIVAITGFVTSIIILKNYKKPIKKGDENDNFTWYKGFSIASLVILSIIFIICMILISRIIGEVIKNPSESSGDIIATTIGLLLLVAGIIVNSIAISKKINYI